MNSFFSILKISSLLVFIILQTNCTNGQSTHEIQPGACQTSSYFPMLQGKRVAIVANHTATIDDVHLVDSLVRAGIEVKKSLARAWFSRYCRSWTKGGRCY